MLEGSPRRCGEVRTVDTLHKTNQKLIIVIIKSIARLTSAHGAEPI